MSFILAPMSPQQGLSRVWHLSEAERVEQIIPQTCVFHKVYRLNIDKDFSAAKFLFASLLVKKLVWICPWSSAAKAQSLRWLLEVFVNRRWEKLRKGKASWEWLFCVLHSVLLVWFHAHSRNKNLLEINNGEQKAGGWRRGEVLWSEEFEAKCVFQSSKLFAGR